MSLARFVGINSHAPLGVHTSSFLVSFPEELTTYLFEEMVEVHYRLRQRGRTLTPRLLR